jgi:hypothetical protein
MSALALASAQKQARRRRAPRPLPGLVRSESKEGIGERARSTRDAVACLWSGLEATLGAGVRGSEMAGRGAPLWFGSDAGSVRQLYAGVSRRRSSRTRRRYTAR